MLSIEKFFERNPSIETASSKTLWALLRYFTEHDKFFSEQKGMMEAVNAVVTPDYQISQAALSKTIRKLMNERLSWNGHLYFLGRRDGQYGLHLAEGGLRELFHLGDIYEKHKVFVASDNMLVLNLQKGKADLFVAALKRCVDENIFFGISTHNDQFVYLLFDMSRTGAQETYDKFFVFFKELFEHMIGITDFSPYISQPKKVTDDR